MNPAPVGNLGRGLGPAQRQAARKIIALCSRRQKTLRRQPQGQHALFNLKLRTTIPGQLLSKTNFVSTRLFQPAGRCSAAHVSYLAAPPGGAACRGPSLRPHEQATLALQRLQPGATQSRAGGKSMPGSDGKDA